MIDTQNPEEHFSHQGYTLVAKTIFLFIVDQDAWKKKEKEMFLNNLLMIIT